MRSTPWNSVVKAIETRDVSSIKALAAQVIDEEEHELLCLLADKLASGRRVSSQRLRWVIGRLATENFAPPITRKAGLPTTAVKQASYESGLYHVELRLEHESGSPHVRLSGRVVPRDRSHGLGELRVAVKSGRRIVTRDLGNEHGEFQVGLVPTRRPYLYLCMKERGDAVEIRLGAMLSRFLIACRKFASHK